MIRTLLALLAAGTLLAGCATVQRYDAAADVHALLVAIRDNDRATFDAHVDKAALKRQLEARLVAETRNAPLRNEWKALGMMLAQPAAFLAGDLLVQPAVFRAAAEYYGYEPTTPIPSSLVIAQSLRYTGDASVCATRSRTGPCLLTFTREGEHWRLTGFNGELSELRLKP
jgi:hypothetical protein